MRTKATAYATTWKDDTDAAVERMLVKRERDVRRRAQIKAADEARQRDAERIAQLTGEPAPRPVKHTAAWWLQKARY